MCIGLYRSGTWRVSSLSALFHCTQALFIQMYCCSFAEWRNWRGNRRARTKIM